MTDDTVEVIRGVFGWNQRPVRTTMTREEISKIPIVPSNNALYNLHIGVQDVNIVPSGIHDLIQSGLHIYYANVITCIIRSLYVDELLSVVGCLEGAEYVLYFVRDTGNVERSFQYYYEFLHDVLGSFNQEATFPILIGSISETFRIETVTLKWAIDNVLKLKYLDTIGYQSAIHTRLYVDQYDGDHSCVKMPGPRSVRARRKADAAMEHLLGQGRILGNPCSTIYIIYTSESFHSIERTTQTLIYLGKFLPIPKHLVNIAMGNPNDAATEMVYDNLDEGIGHVYS